MDVRGGAAWFPVLGPSLVGSDGADECAGGRSTRSSTWVEKNATVGITITSITMTQNDGRRNSGALGP
ncbi:MAG TPA: hypothetical protein VEZ44_02340 [bacterium]|nr:hypothetical protein [bacterium]